MVRSTVGSFLLTATSGAAVAATRTKQNVVVTARTKGSAGNSIAPAFVSVGGESLSLADTANAPTVHLATSAAVKAHVQQPSTGFSWRAKVAGTGGNAITITFVETPGGGA